MTNPKYKDLDHRSIEDASSSEIRAYALNACGIEFNEDAARSTMVDGVIEAQGWLRKDPEEGATHVEILITREPGELGNHPYRGGANGKMFSVKRGEPVVIPMHYYEAIRSSQARPGFTIVPVGEHFGEEDPSQKRIPLTGLPISVLRWITK